MNNGQGITPPELQPWMKIVLGATFGLYVIELVLTNLKVNLVPLYLLPLDGGLQPWQPLTRFLVQGGGPALFGVVIGLVVLYFALPILELLLDRRRWTELLITAWLFASALPVLTDSLGLLTPVPRMGWSFLILPVFLVVGLAQPRAQINLMFVLPVPARWIVWGTLVFGLLMLLAAPTSASLEPLAAWIGVMAWWTLRGPGARERALRRKGARIEQELRRFEVLEGGLGSQGGLRDPGDDEWVN